MPGYTFKTYIYNGREYYEYDAVPTDRDEYAEPDPKKTPVLVKKDFLFPESLLSLLYLDIRTYEPLFANIAASLRELRRTKEAHFRPPASLASWPPSTFTLNCSRWSGGSACGAYCGMISRESRS